MYLLWLSLVENFVDVTQCIHQLGHHNLRNIKRDGYYT